MVAGSEDARLLRVINRLSALRWIILDEDLLAIFWVRTLPDLIYVFEIARAEAVEGTVDPLLHVLSRLGELVVGNVRDIEHFGDVSAGYLLQSLGVGHLMYAAAH